MLKNKIFNFIIFASLVLVLFFIAFPVVKAAEILPDNVKITTSPDGASTTVVINSKPGFATSVQTNCVNGKCTNTATSKEITEKEIKNMQDNMKKQQEAMQKFWQMQDELFRQQQKMFQDLWGINWF